MKDTIQDLNNDPVYAAQLNNLIARSTGVEYRGKSDSWHLLHYLVRNRFRQGDNAVVILFS